MSRSLQAVDQMVPGANLPAYIQSVSSIPILSVERERQLAEDLYFNDNLEAARELVMSHLRFVVHIARSYSGYGLAEADLIQEKPVPSWALFGDGRGMSENDPRQDHYWNGVEMA